MKILQINSVNNTGSTGQIVNQINQLLKNNGCESYVAFGRGNKKIDFNEYKIGSSLDIIINGIVTRLFDNHGFGFKIGTLKLIEYINTIKPDLIHLHNLHGYYINIEILINYIKKNNIPVVLTLHDCWTFTGHCAYFDYIGCEKWKTHCSNCPQIRSYPSSIFIDNSYNNYKKKRDLLNSISNLTIVPVSTWLNSLIDDSFLANNSRIVIRNGIDLSVFKIYNSKNKIIKKFNLKGKYIILAVANIWSKRKGMDDILKIAKNLGDSYSFIIVGGRIKFKKNKNDNITIIKRTENQEELAELYSAADLFINPTYEDTLPTTNMEALACGTPVLTYNTGGSPELIDNETGFIVNKGDINTFIKTIQYICYNNKKTDMQLSCRKRAEKYFNKDDRFLDYLRLYERILKVE